MTRPRSRAPISSAERRRLQHDAADVLATAKRKGLVIDRMEASDENTAAREHFELGCWLFYYSLRVGRTDGLTHRIACVRRLFEAGIRSPGYRFHTVFDFGERQFDTCFEMGDGSAVVAALLDLADEDPRGKLAGCVRDMGWTRKPPPQAGLFDVAATAPLTQLAGG